MKLIEFKVLLLDLNIIAEEKDGEEKGNREKVAYCFKSLFGYSELPGLSSLMRKDKDTEVLFVQGNPLVSSLYGGV